jgi:hypothetical protein
MDTVTRNKLATLHLGAKRSLTELNSLLSQSPEILINEDSYLLHVDGRIIGHLLKDNTLIKQLLREFQLASVTCDMQELSLWEEEGFVVEKSKYRLCPNKNKIPLKYCGPIDVSQGISDNHKFLKQFKEKKSSSISEHKELNKLIPGLSNAQNHLLHDTYDKVKSLVPEGNINNADLGKILSQITKHKK